MRLVDRRQRRPSTKRFVFVLYARVHDENEAFGQWAPLAPINQTHWTSVQDENEAFGRRASLAPIAKHIKRKNDTLL